MDEIVTCRRFIGVRLCLCVFVVHSPYIRIPLYPYPVDVSLRFGYRACLPARVCIRMCEFDAFMCAYESYNGFHLVQDVIYPVRSLIHTHAHLNTTRSVCLGMRLIYSWTHVRRAHVHVYQMNFIGLCARLCMATSLSVSMCTAYVYVFHVYFLCSTAISTEWFH